MDIIPVSDVRFANNFHSVVWVFIKKLVILKFERRNKKTIIFYRRYDYIHGNHVMQLKILKIELFSEFTPN